MVDKMLLTDWAVVQLMIQRKKQKTTETEREKQKHLTHQPVPKGLSVCVGAFRSYQVTDCVLLL